MVKLCQIPDSIPEMDTLTKDQEKLVNTLLEEVLTHYKGEYPPQFKICQSDEDKHILAYKYLKARHWVFKDALEMVKSTALFREERKVDSMALFPCAFPIRGYDEEDVCRVLNLPYPVKNKEIEMDYRAIGPYYTNAYHFWDKGGHPVLYDFIGRCRVKELLKSVALVTRVGEQSKDTVVRYHIYMNSIQERLIHYADKKSLESGGGRILGITVIFDAEGVHFGMVSSQILNIMQAVVQIDGSYYPEVLYRLFVINCPSIITRIYNLIKGSLDVNTQNKITFCDKKDSQELLRKIIDEDKIPKFLGGTCECAGGCVPGVDGVCATLDDGDKDMNNDGERILMPLTEDISLGAGKKHLIKINMKRDDEWQWEFQCTKSREGASVNIHFVVKFQPCTTLDNIDEEFRNSGEGSKSSKQASFSSPDCHLIKTIKAEKTHKDHGQYKSTEEGILHLEWDNCSSWIHGKHLQVRTFPVKIS